MHLYNDLTLRRRKSRIFLFHCLSYNISMFLIRFWSICFPQGRILHQTYFTVIPPSWSRYLLSFSIFIFVYTLRTGYHITLVHFTYIVNRWFIKYFLIFWCLVFLNHTVLQTKNIDEYLLVIAAVYFHFFNFYLFFSSGN